MNYETFRSLINEFADWLIGIEEDDPLDFEIKYIFFSYERCNATPMLRYGASDKNLAYFGNSDYCPLEAQFFYSHTFLRINANDFSLSMFRELIGEMLKNDVLHKLFYSKTIFLFYNGKKYLY